MFSMFILLQSIKHLKCMDGLCCRNREDRVQDEPICFKLVNVEHNRVTIYVFDRN